jgi:sulfate permease, SulP family
MNQTHRSPAVANWLLAYNKDWLRPDIVAGLTTAAVVIPKAMAYATIAGLPVEIGLYTAFLPMVIYAVLGTSRPLSVSTTTTLAILTAAELGQAAPNGDPSALLQATVTLTVLVGAILVLASVLRLGFIANFISEPVLVGFKAGIGVVIVLDQVPKLLGTHIPHGGFLQNILATLQSVPHASLPTVAVGLAMIALLIGVEHFVPRLPAPLIAVAVGIAGSALLGLQSHGVALVGKIPQGLPSMVLPDLALVKVLWPGALGIALMSFTETIAAGRAFAGRDEPNPRPNLELLATGLANVGGAFLGSMPAGGGTSQTAVNRLAGARSQLSELVTAAASLATMLLLAPLLALMPMATLAAVVIVYSIGLIRPDEFKDILAVRRMEFIWALTAFAGVMLLGTLKGILVAIVVSMVALAYQAADPPVYALGRKRSTNVFRPLSDENTDDETYPGLLLLRLEGRIFFANAGHIEEKIRALVEEANPRVVALHLRAVTDLEYTALKSLTEGERRQREHGVSLWLVGMNPAVQNVVERSPLGQELEKRGGVLANLETAVAKYLESFSSTT